MKKITFFLIIIISAFFQKANANISHSGSQANITISRVQNELTIGESLEYSAEWFGICVGTVTLQVVGLENISGHECYHIYGKAVPNRFFSKIYDIEYRVHTYLDKQGLFSRRFEKIRRIKKSFIYVISEFDQEGHEAIYTYYLPSGPIDAITFEAVHKNMPAQINERYKIPERVQDLFSSVYYFRLLNIEPKKSYPIVIAYERNNWPVDIRLGSIFHKDIHKKGRLRAVSVFPDSDLSDSVLGKRDISVIFSLDSRRIPLEFRIHSKMGFIRGIIKNIPQ